MDKALQPMIEMNEKIWDGLRKDLSDVGPDEADWRPLPQANSINVIVRHLRIEAEWKLASLEHGEQEPSELTPAIQQFIDSVPMNFEQNLKKLDELCTRFNAVLRESFSEDLEKRSSLVYKGYPAVSPYSLFFHHPMHQAMHWGQIRTIRTLYLKTRGEPVPEGFFPDNPSYPK